MIKPFIQGYLDCLCGIYSIINAERILHLSTSEKSQELFYEIVKFLSKKRKLKNIMINGIGHREMRMIVENSGLNIFSEWETNKKGFLSIKEWWQFSKKFMDDGWIIILSVGGKEEHLTVIKSMTNKSMTLFDSGINGGIKKILKSQCRLKGYLKEDKYIIFPSQCWYIKS